MTSHVTEQTAVTFNHNLHKIHIWIISTNTLESLEKLRFAILNTLRLFVLFSFLSEKRTLCIDNNDNTHTHTHTLIITV